MIARWRARRAFMREHAWTQDHLTAYAAGDELAAEEAARVERHASLCPQCSKLLESLRRTLTGLRELRAGSPDRDVADGVIARLRGSP